MIDIVTIEEYIQNEMEDNFFNDYLSSHINSHISQYRELFCQYDNYGTNCINFIQFYSYIPNFTSLIIDINNKSIIFRSGREDMFIITKITNWSKDINEFILKRSEQIKDIDRYFLAI